MKATQRYKEQKSQKGCMIRMTHTVVDPWAVMVHLLNAPGGQNIRKWCANTEQHSETALRAALDAMSPEFLSGILPTELLSQHS